MAPCTAVVAGALAVLLVGCPQKPNEGPGGEPSGGKGGAHGGGLKTGPDDPRFSKAEPIEAVTVLTEMSQDVPLETEGRTPQEIAMAKAMAELSKFPMTVAITDGRTRMTITGKNMPMGAGSYVVHDGPGQRYAFVEAGKNEYRLLNGAEVTALFEGGPTTGRSNYRVTVTDTADKKTVAGFEAQRSDVEVSFDWLVKFENKTKTGKTRARLAVFHSGDPRLKPAWAREMIDFLTLPFQDEEGRKVAETLKARLKFPLRWRMEVIVDGLETEARPPVIQTAATQVTIGKLPANTFQIPPAGLVAAEGPWNPGKGAATMTEQEIGKLREKPEPRRPDDNAEAPGEEK